MISIFTLLLSIFLYIKVNNEELNIENNKIETEISESERFIEIRDKVYSLFIYGVELYSNNAINFIESGTYDNIYAYYYEMKYPYLINDDSESGNHKEYSKALLENIDVSDDASNYYDLAYAYASKVNELEAYAIHLACEYNSYDLEDLPGFVKDSIWFVEDDDLDIDEKYEKAKKVITEEIIDGFEYSYSQYMDLVLQNMDEFKAKTDIDVSDIEIDDTSEDNLDTYKYDVYFAVTISIYISLMFLLEMLDIFINKYNVDHNILNELIMILMSIILFVINVKYMQYSYTNSIYENSIDFNLKGYRYLILLIFIIFNMVNLIIKIIKKKDKELEESIAKDASTLPIEIEEKKIDKVSQNIEEVKTIQEEINFEYIDNQKRRRKLLFTTIENNNMLDDINNLFDSVDNDSLEKYDVLKDKSDKEIKDLFS